MLDRAPSSDTFQWQALEAFFQELPGRITPDSFRANYLPLLNLLTAILEALHRGKMEYTASPQRYRRQK